jgi:aspartate racemase
MTTSRQKPDGLTNPATLWPRRIGILGGMGPFAHLALERHLLDAATRRLAPYPVSDQQFPHWILSSLPHTPDRSAAVLAGGPSPLPLLIEGLQLLATADFVVIACNTAHIFIEQLRDRSKLPILDLVGETIKEVSGHYKRKVKIGLLATTGTLRSGLYQQTARKVCPHVELVTPLDLKVGTLNGEDIQKRYVTDVIFGRSSDPDDLRGGIKAGSHLAPDLRRKMRTSLRRLFGWLGETGVRTVILGCTELPLVLDTDSFNDLLVVDPLRIIASSAVRIAAGTRPLPT